MCVCRSVAKFSVARWLLFYYIDKNVWCGYLSRRLCVDLIVARYFAAQGQGMIILMASTLSSYY